MKPSERKFVLVRVAQLTKPLQVEVTPSSFDGTTRPTVVNLRSRILANVNDMIMEQENANRDTTSHSEPFLYYRNCRILRRGVELRDDRPVEQDTFTPDEHLQVLLTDRQTVGEAPTTIAPPRQPVATASFPVLGSGSLTVRPPPSTSGSDGQATVPAPREGEGRPSLQGRLSQEQIENLREMFISALIEQNSPQNRRGGDAAERNNNRAAALSSAYRRRRTRASGQRTVSDGQHEEIPPPPGATAAPTRLVEGTADNDPDAGPDNRLRLRDLILQSMKEPWWRFFVGAFLGFVFIPSLLLLLFCSVAKNDEKRGVTGQYVRYRQGATSEERKKARRECAEIIRRYVDKVIANETLASANTADALIDIPLAPMQRENSGQSPTNVHRAHPGKASVPSLSDSPLETQSAPSQTAESAPAARISNLPFFALRDTSTQQSTALHDWAVSSGLIRFRFGVLGGVIMNLVVGMVTTVNVNTLVVQS